VILTAAKHVNQDLANNRKALQFQSQLRESALSGARGDGSAYVEPLLRLESVQFAYGGVRCLTDITFRVLPHTRPVILGTNGSGKSTLLKVASGLLEPDEGRIYIKGEEVTSMPPFDRARLGMTLIEGGKSTFPSLTVAETLRLGAQPFVRSRREIQVREDDVFELFPQMYPHRNQKAGTLSGGEQQMLALARTLMAGTEFLLVDELSLGLAPVVVDEMLRVLDQLALRGTTILAVEQSVGLGLEIGSEIYRMERGHLSLVGRPAEIDPVELEALILFGSAAAQP
jgi:ABC-type branched-subunit amino acid transport system ATPase component